MNQAHLQRLLLRYQQGHCTPEEQQLVEAWYEELGTPEAPQLPAAERQMLQATLWDRIAQDTVGQQATAPHRQLGGWWQAAPVRWVAAAVLAIGVGTAGIGLLRPTGSESTAQQQTVVATPPPVWSADTRVVVANTTRRTTTMKLPDGSTVELAPGSRLQYPQGLSGAYRRVYLTGEALFDVQHDATRPFLVVTDKLVTTVLGTRFTVRAYANQPQVLVKVRRGKVRVSPRLPDARGDEALPPMLASIVVRPNQQAVYSPVVQELKKELVTQPDVLISQSFAFEDQPVSVVLEALKKAYGVDIIYDKDVLASCTVSMVLKNGSLFDKLGILCKALGATYELLDTQVVVHSRSCKG